MDVRLRTEEIEHLTFAPWASFSDQSRGRARPEPQDPLRPVYQRDRDRIIHCKAFRRLKQKTQVFLLLGLAATIIAGYFSVSICLTILCCVLFLSLSCLVCKLYYSRKF